MLKQSNIDSQILNIIFNCASDNDYFYLASYFYGEKILSHSQFVINEPSIFEELSYNHGSHPFGLILENTIELFYPSKTNIFPYLVFESGNFVSASLILDKDNSYHPKFSWSITAGIRSAFLLNSVQRKKNYSSINNILGEEIEPSENIMDQFEIFKKISSLENNWKTKILYFPQRIISKLDTSWYPLKRYLLDTRWHASGYLRDSIFWNTIYSIAAANRNLRLSAYDLAVIRQIISIATGNSLGYAPCMNDKFLPLSLIQETYFNLYGLNEILQTPTIMTPRFFSQNEISQNSMYYSLQHPNNIETPIKYDSHRSGRQYIGHLEYIFTRLIDEIIHVANADYTPIIKALKNINFEFCENVDTLLNEDISFSYYHPNKNYLNSKYEISPKNKFLRSYIKITRNNNGNV